MSDIMLSIIIPHHKETPQELFPILSILNGQLGIDFNKTEILLVGDSGGNIPPNDFLSLFQNLNLRTLLMNENKGPGMARQFGIDDAKGQYVMFCDADDSLMGVFVINAFLDEIEKHNPELIISSWLEEYNNKDTGVYKYIQHDVDFTWMHGKAFKKSFLKEKNICFHEKLWIHEDNYFMTLVFVEADDVRKITATTYIWKYCSDSITRRNNASYIYETIPDFVKSTKYVFNEIEKRHPEQMPTCVTQGIINLYFILHKGEWKNTKRAKLLKKAEASFGQMIKPFLHYYKSLPQSVVTSMYNNARATSFKGEIETERLDSWIERIT